MSTVKKNSCYVLGAVKSSCMGTSKSSLKILLGTSIFGRLSAMTREIWLFQCSSHDEAISIQHTYTYTHTKKGACAGVVCSVGLVKAFPMDDFSRVTNYWQGGT